MKSDETFEICFPELSNYRISKTGNIYTNDSNNIINHRISNGYKMVGLNTLNGYKTYTLHRLVAMTFIPNPNNYPVVNHINENRMDNKVENLEWVTQKENVNKSSKITSHSRKVLQIYDDNVFIEYDSITEAAQEMNLSRAAISKACLGINKSAGGYKWKYSDNNNNYELGFDLDNAKRIEDTNYFIFKNGDVYNLSRKKMLKPVKNLNGCYYVTISSPNGKKNHYVNKLVIDYFNDNSEYRSILEEQSNHIQASGTKLSEEIQ